MHLGQLLNLWSEGTLTMLNEVQACDNVYL